MKKILIWDYNLKLSNKGGPAGYLYNIKCGLSDNYEKEIIFISDLLRIDNKINDVSKGSLHKKSTILYNLKNIIRLVYIWYIKRYNPNLKIIDFNKFDVIHFHSAIELSQYAHLLKSYNGKIVLTSHSPQPLCDEFLESNINSRILINILKPFVRYRELRTWKKADFLMFPTEESVEAYYVYNKMRKYFLKNRTKFIFCPSSISEKVTKRENIDIRGKLNLPKNSFILSFIGRHNEIKGYDFLKKLGNSLLQRIPNLYIVVGGNETPLKGLTNERWIELGWINFGPELIRQSNVFILPNKSTYFDLVALEVLREGTPIIMSYTGGNKFFVSNGSPLSTGIFVYNSGDTCKAEEIIIKIMESSPEQVNSYRNNNKKLFKERFTTKNFLIQYRKLMESL